MHRAAYNRSQTNGSETKPVGPNLRIESTLLSSLIFPRSSALQRISLFDPEDVQFVTRYNLCPIQFVSDTICVRYKLCRYNFCRYNLCRYNLFPIQFVPIQFVHEPAFMLKNNRYRYHFTLCTAGADTFTKQC